MGSADWLRGIRRPAGPLLLLPISHFYFCFASFPSILVPFYVTVNTTWCLSCIHCVLMLHFVNAVFNGAAM